MGQVRNKSLEESKPTVDQEKQGQASEYARIRRLLLLVDLVIVAGFLLLLLTSGASVALKEAGMTISDNLFIVRALYLLGFYAAYALITLPVGLYRGYTLAHRFGLSRQTLGDWFADWLKANGIGLLLGLLFVEVLYLLLDAFPDFWWIPAGFGFILFTVVLANLAPILLVPLFYKLRPLDDQELVARLTALAERAGTRVRGVYTMEMSRKTAAANAALMGLGNTRRIVVGDTLIEGFTPDEIETVMAHELGHHAHGDVPKLIGIEGITTFFGLFVVNVALHWAVATFRFESVADIAALPVLVLTLGAVSFALMPLTNGFSRRLEAQADRYALELTDKPQAFAATMIKLANQNLAELRPPAWVEFLLYDHPALGRRIKVAERFAGQW